MHLLHHCLSAEEQTELFATVLPATSVADDRSPSPHDLAWPARRNSAANRSDTSESGPGPPTVLLAAQYFPEAECTHSAPPATTPSPRSRRSSDRHTADPANPPNTDHGTSHGMSQHPHAAANPTKKHSQVRPLLISLTFAGVSIETIISKS